MNQDVEVGEAICPCCGCDDPVDNTRLKLLETLMDHKRLAWRAMRYFRCQGCESDFRVITKCPECSWVVVNVVLPNMESYTDYYLHCGSCGHQWRPYFFLEDKPKIARKIILATGLLLLFVLAVFGAIYLLGF